MDNAIVSFSDYIMWRLFCQSRGTEGLKKKNYGERASVGRKIWEKSRLKLAIPVILDYASYTHKEPAPETL